MATDPDYRANQQDAYRSWRSKNPDYWRRRPGTADQNTSPPTSVTPPAERRKMDASTGNYSFISGKYLLVPVLPGRCKMDTLMVNITQVSTG
jgi:hypothetical protein